MITKKEVDIIRSMLLQPHGSGFKLITIFGGSKNTNLRVDDYAYALLSFYGTQYSAAHPEISYHGKPNGKMGLSRFIAVMVKYFAQQEPWIWADNPKLDKYKYHVDLLYAVQCVKKIFNGYITNPKLHTQSDVVVALIGWNLARIRENADGEECKGFIDYEYEDNGNHEQEKESIPSPIVHLDTPSKLLPPELNSIDDLFEEDEPDKPLSPNFLREGK